MANRKFTENEYADLCEEAIEATACQLGPDVDPAALAETARDGTFLSDAVLLACAGPMDLTPMKRRSFREQILDKLAALRAGKGGE